MQFGTCNQQESNICMSWEVGNPHVSEQYIYIYMGEKAVGEMEEKSLRQGLPQWLPRVLRPRHRHWQRGPYVLQSWEVPPSKGYFRKEHPKPKWMINGGTSMISETPTHEWDWRGQVDGFHPIVVLNRKDPKRSKMVKAAINHLSIISTIIHYPSIIIYQSSR